jgi:PBSX family phage terminase large subunit
VSPYEPPTGKLLRSVLDSTGRLNLWDGSVRSAKTITSLWRWMQFVTLEAAPGPLAMVGQTLDSLRRNVLEPMAELFGEGVVEDRTRSYRQVRIGSRLAHCMGASDSRAERKVRGLTLAGVYVDEASLVSEQLFSRLVDRMSAPGAKLFMTTNPESPTHWLNRKWRLRAREVDLRLFHFTLDDNPWLDPAYVAHVRASYSGVWYRRYVLGEWVTAEGAVWPSFDPRRHVTAQLPPQLLHLRLPVDYGTVNPLAGLLIGVGVDPADPGPDGERDYARLYVAREWRWDSQERQQQLTDVAYSSRLRAWMAGGYQAPPWQTPAGPVEAGPPERVVVDPSAASFITQLQGDRVYGVEGADNRVADGLRVVDSLWNLDRLRVHPSCSGLIEEVPGYEWDEKAVGHGEERPVKAQDHSCDALRYGVMSLWHVWRWWVTNPPQPA